jgi:hypothetical protein
VTTTHAFFINSVDVTDYVLKARLPTHDTIDKDDTGSIELSTGVTAVLPYLQANFSFKYYRGETSADVQRFKGFLGPFITGVDKITVKAYGDLMKLDRRELNYTFNSNIDDEAGVISEIAATIMTDGDVTPNVVNSGTTTIINEFQCRRELRSRKLIELKNLLRWTCYYDHTAGEGRFEPHSYTDSGTTVTVGLYPVVNSPLWEVDDSSLFNIFTVEGLEVQVGKVEWFNGDGSNDVFTLSEAPVSITNVFSGSSNFQTTLPVTADLKKGGALGVTTDADYTYNEGNADVTFSSTAIPSSGTNNVQISYLYNEGIPGYFIHEESINTYGSREKTVSVLYVRNIEDVETVGMSLVGYYKDPKETTTLQLGNDCTEFPASNTIRPNQVLTVIDDQNPIKKNKRLPIRKLTLNYPEPYDSVEVGDYTISVNDFLERTVDRIKKLEDRFKSQGSLRQYRFSERNVEFPVRAEVYQATKTSGVLYWNDATQGTWGDFVWSDGTEETYSLVRRVHNVNGVCFFDLYDDDLIDTAATTATLDTTAGSVTFTDGQVLITELLFLDNTAFSSIMVETLDSTITGTVNIYACANGDTETWEAVTPNAVHYFVTSTTGGVKIRLVASGSASVLYRDPDNKGYTPWKITVN